MNKEIDTMKKKFLIPEAEIITFDDEDIIRTSGEGKVGGDLSDPGLGDEPGFGS